MNRPNVLFIITDDQGYGDLGCHGNPIIKTPNIDALYRKSLRLTNFHVGPTCAPTRAGLLTGRYCNCTGVWHTIGGRSLIRKDEVTLANILGESGYRTGLFGKWHLGDNYPFRPFDRGFDTAITHGGGGIGQTPDYWGNDYFDDTYACNGSRQKFEGYCTDVWFREAARFIEGCGDEPFFCFLSTNAPHSPYRVEEQYSSQYRGQVPDERANFYGMISCIDDNVGWIRNKLEELGIADNTILIFMTDNGTSGGCDIDEMAFVTEGYNAGMRGRKSSEYEGGHRVPFFLHWPAGGLVGGCDIKELTANIDITPTVAELCGASLPQNTEIHGKSLVPLLKEQANDWNDRIIVTDSQRVENPVKWKQSATMTQRWRLINGRELYDILEDQEQRHDIASQHPDVVQELRSYYEHWWDLVSKRFDEYCPIILGTERESETMLNSHDWHGKEIAWNQGLVREGLQCNGYWIIDAAVDGDYRFELRRWPREENRAIVEGIPGEIDWYHGGRALKVLNAKIEVDALKYKQVVNSSAVSVVFTIHLTKGVKKLWADFSDDEQKRTGAYYVYVSLCRGD